MFTITPKKSNLVVAEIKIIPVTIRSNAGDRHGWKGYAYAPAITDYCPCCNQPLTPCHATKETLSMSHAALLMEDFLK